MKSWFTNCRMVRCCTRGCWLAWSDVTAVWWSEVSAAWRSEVMSGHHAPMLGLLWTAAGRVQCYSRFDSKNGGMRLTVTPSWKFSTASGLSVAAAPPLGPGP